MASFERWSEVVREPLVWMGLRDPAEALVAKARPSLNTVGGLKAANTPSNPVPKYLLDFLYALTGGRKFSARDLHQKLEGGDFIADELRPLFSDRDGKCTCLSVGKGLSRLKNIRYGDHTVEAVGSSGGVLSWIVIDEPFSGRVDQ